MYVLIVGAGKVGWNLARELINKAHEVTAIETDQAPCASRRAEHSAQYGDGSELWCSSAPGSSAPTSWWPLPATTRTTSSSRRSRARSTGSPALRCNNPRNFPHFELLGVARDFLATDLILR